MGQAQVQAAKEAAPAPVAAAHSSISKHAHELKQIASLSYELFLQSIQNLNKITHSFSDINGKNLVFQVKKDTDTTILWKGTVRIRCHKVNSRSGSIESSRILNLKQYIHLHNEISRQAAMITTQTESHMDTSTIFVQLDQHLSEAGSMDTETEECCICMDRKAEVILTCSHMYCEQCIDEWNVNHKTCPICRARVNTADDTWVLTEKPDSNEMAYETTEYLMGLTERSGYEAISSSSNGAMSADGGGGTGAGS